MLSNTIVIYHGHCPDGWCAAWAVHKHFKDNNLPLPSFHLGLYGDTPPDIKDKNVIIVDFSYDRAALTMIANDAASLTVLDHHKTAKAALDGFEAEMKKAGNIVTVQFDMDRSGAGITWDFYHKEERPWIVSYVEDKDLWRFQLPESNSIDAYISALPFDFEVWSKASSNNNIKNIVEKGKIVELKRKKYIDFVLSANTYLTKFHDSIVPVVNCPQIDISHVLAELMTRSGAPFVIGFSQRSDGMIQYSLRSTSDVDVSEIAKLYGGGGHMNAAGFQTISLIHEFYGVC